MSVIHKRMLIFLGSLLSIYLCPQDSVAQSLLSLEPESAHDSVECPRFSESDTSMYCYAQTLDEDPNSPPLEEQTIGEDSAVFLFRLGNRQAKGPAYCANKSCGRITSHRYCPYGQIAKSGFGPDRDCKTVTMADQVCYNPNLPIEGQDNYPTCPDVGIAGVVIPIWKNLLPFTSNPGDKGLCVPEWSAKEMQNYLKYQIERCNLKKVTEFECQAWCDVQFRGLAEAIKECYLSCRALALSQ